MGAVAFFGFIIMVLGIVGTIMHYFGNLGSLYSNVTPAITASMAIIGFFTLILCVAMK